MTEDPVATDAEYIDDEAPIGEVITADEDQ